MTLFDVYAINQALIAQPIARGEEMPSTPHLLVDIDTYLAHSRPQPTPLGAR